MVVLPALSSPSTRILSSYFLFFLRLRSMPMSPPAWVDMIVFLNEYESIKNQHIIFYFEFRD